MLRDRKLLAVTRPEGMVAVPAAFLDGHQVVKGLCGTLTLLFDCGFDELEALRWLFTEDDSLPGTPIDAIVRHRGTEVNRRAQALAFSERLGWLSCRRARRACGEPRARHRRAPPASRA